MVKKKKSIKRNNQKKLFSIVGAILLVLAGITIAYAALSATLNITINKVTQNAQTWNVQFDTTAVTPTVTGSGATCPAVTPTALAVAVGNVVLDYPGDQCTYALKIKNTGTIAAKLSNIKQITNGTAGTTNMSSASFKLGPSTNGTDPYVLVELRYNSATGSALTTSSLASYAAGSTTNVYLILKHNDGATSTVSTTQEFTGVGFQLNFAQN